MLPIGLLAACSTSGAAPSTTTSAVVALTTSAPTATSGSTITDGPMTTVGSTTTSIPVATSSTTSVDAGDLVGWETMTITVGNIELLVAVADDPAERSQGLTGIQQLGDLDGMLFVFPRETLAGFWMKGTPISLDIAFFGEDRALVDVMNMVPCVADPCPSYVPNAPFSWALETPAGLLEPLAPGTILAIGE